jgi:hypothetical protein
MSSRKTCSGPVPTKAATQSAHVRNALYDDRSVSPTPSPTLMQLDQSSQSKYTNEPTYQFRPCSHPIEEICQATNYLELLPADFKREMLRFICRQAANGLSVYAEYNAPPIAEQINGAGDYFLKKIAEETNIYLIWYNRKCGVYMFWGANEHNVRNALNRIRDRIVKHGLHVASPGLYILSHNNIARSPSPPCPPPRHQSLPQKTFRPIQEED